MKDFNWLHILCSNNILEQTQKLEKHIAYIFFSFKKMNSYEKCMCDLNNYFNIISMNVFILILLFLLFTFLNKDCLYHCYKRGAYNVQKLFRVKLSFLVIILSLR